jgi:hypothetical protein
VGSKLAYHVRIAACGEWFTRPGAFPLCYSHRAPITNKHITLKLHDRDALWDPWSCRYLQLNIVAMFNFTPLLGAQSASAASQSLLEFDGGIKILIDVGWDESFDVAKLKEIER